MQRDFYNALLICIVFVAVFFIATPVPCSAQESSESDATLNAASAPKLTMIVSETPDKIAEIIRNVRQMIPGQLEGLLRQKEFNPSELVVDKDKLPDLKEILFQAQAHGLIPEDVLIRFSMPPKPEAPQEYTVYFLQKEEVFDCDGLVSVTALPDPNNGYYWKIAFSFNEETGQAFGDYTFSHKNQLMAILFDDVVLSAATIRERITTRGEIWGSFSAEEAQGIAKALNPIPEKESFKNSVTGALRALILIILLTCTYVFVIRPRLRYEPRHSTAPPGPEGENEDLDVVRSEGKDYRPD